MKIGGVDRDIKLHVIQDESTSLTCSEERPEAPTQPVVAQPKDRNLLKMSFNSRTRKGRKHLDSSVVVIRVNKFGEGK